MQYLTKPEIPKVDTFWHRNPQKMGRNQLYTPELNSHNGWYHHSCLFQKSYFSEFTSSFVLLFLWIPDNRHFFQSPRHIFNFFFFFFFVCPQKKKVLQWRSSFLQEKKNNFLGWFSFLHPLISKFQSFILLWFVLKMKKLIMVVPSKWLNSLMVYVT